MESRQPVTSNKKCTRARKKPAPFFEESDSDVPTGTKLRLSPGDELPSAPNGVAENPLTTTSGLPRLKDFLRAKSHTDTNGKYRVVNNEEGIADGNLVDSIYVGSDSDSSLTDIPSDDEASFGQQEFVGPDQPDDDEVEEPEDLLLPHPSRHQREPQRQRQHQHRNGVKSSGIKLTLTDINKKRASQLTVFANGSRSRPELFRFQCPAPSCGLRPIATTVYKAFAKARPDSQRRSLRFRNESISLWLSLRLSGWPYAAHSHHQVSVCSTSVGRRGFQT